jgi:3-hydroxyacyl-[acyl-carrier-protein] dehydratase
MIDSIYKLEKKEETSEVETNYQLLLDKSHPIFEGHFPGYPVLPGVVQIAIVTELLEKKLNKKLQLLKASNTKFLKMIDPLTMETIHLTTKVLSLTENGVKISSSIASEAGVCLKYKAQYKFA